MAWFKSLYWRIAAGFVLFLALTLATQGGLFVWVVVRGESEVTPKALETLASVVAQSIASELEKNPRADLNSHLTDRFGTLRRPLAVVMADGRVITGRWGPLPPPLAQTAMVRMRLGAGGRLPDDPELASDRPPRLPPGPRRGPGDDGGAEGDRPPRHRAAFAPIVVRGRTEGTVIVLAGRASASVLSDIGPVLGLTALGLVIGAGALAAVFMFRPAHRRLQALAQAARRLGAGDAAARAPEEGRDEIAGVARAFNQMASDLVERAEQLQMADRQRRQLLADVSHELMTPLTAIRGYTETLAMPALAADEKTRSRYLEIVREETARLEGIIGDLLDLARLEAGGGSFTIQDVRVVDLFTRVRDRHEPAAREKQIELVVRGGEGLELAGDRLRLEQALQNLATNALRHTPPGGRIELAATRRGSQVLLTVSDTGEGIAPEHLPHVFDRFYKADVSRLVGGLGTGSGLGLSIVKAIVERHGGSVSVRSTPGEGTTFQMILPSE
jgi:signal transduction histidine kinase